MPARHVEIQVLCDAHGGVLTLGERECSIQRRHQKLIEESPSPALDAGDAARRWRRPPSARAARSATATPARSSSCSAPDGSFYFIELNARLQVEHPVTELVTGIDIVREQVRIAAGEPLSLTGRAPRKGHAIEMRINAEDPARDFRPRPARIDALPAAARPGRPARHVRRGGRGRSRRTTTRWSRSSSSWDVDRPAAIRRALRALGELEVEGVPTTRAARCARSCARSEFACGALLDELPGGGAGGCSALAADRSRRRRGGRRSFLLYQWDVTGQALGSLYEGEVTRVRAGARPRRVVERAPRARRADHRGVRGLAGRPAGRASSATCCRIAIAGARGRATSRTRSRSTRRSSCEAVHDRRGRAGS